MCCGTNLGRINTSDRITGHQARNTDENCGKKTKKKYFTVWV
jgi:hypothetical protein